jgi:hypothetical protein
MVARFAPVKQAALSENSVTELFYGFPKGGELAGALGQALCLRQEVAEIVISSAATQQ